MLGRNQAASGENLCWRRWLSLFVLLFLYALASTSGYAQSAPRNADGTHGKKHLTAVRTELPVILDGSLDEPAWQQAQASREFLQKDPQEGEPSSERTEFRVLYTATTLYIGVICYDSNPAGILATERRRDNDLRTDDAVTIVLDTFHDHRNAFLFRTNPLGTEYDALITDEGKNVNVHWDERWDVVSQITSAGWTAEFAIPFKSLRVSESEQEGQIWGLDLERMIRRKNEWAYWNGFRRGFQLEDVSQAGHLEGLKDIETGMRLRVKPFSLAGFSQSSDGSRSTFRNASDFGLEVMKWRITPSLTADATWRTDFAQTEVDDLRVNLDRFPLFFPERREFFQEGSGIFDFGTVTRGITSNLRLFHSRRIGLSPRRRPVPIVAGGRITGRLQGFTLGLLNVQTESFQPENIPASNYGVLRVKRDVLSRSAVGAFLMNREKAGGSDFNRVYGVDSIFVFRRHFTIDGFLAKSNKPGVDGNWAASANAKWNSDFLLAGMEFLSIDPNFRDDLGFVRRTDIRRFAPSLAIRPRPSIRGVRQMEFLGTLDYMIDHNNRVVRRTDKYIFQTFFEDSGILRIIPLVYNFDRVEVPFEISQGVTIPAGNYSWNVYVLRYTLSPARKLSGTLDFSHRYGFYGGNMYKWQFTPLLKLTENLSVNANYLIHDATLPGGSFVDHIVNTRINYAFNNQWLTSTTLQYDNSSSFVGFNFRLNYIFRPGDDFFLVYNEGRRALFEDIGNVERRVTGVFDGQKDRSLLVKLTYSFDY